MKLPKEQLTGSIVVNKEKDGAKRYIPIEYLCRNCGKEIKLKRKSLDSFCAECDYCGFKEDINLR
jgi:DNA-directed RNA polymerase subunit RPC12/RpoP